LVKTFGYSVPDIFAKVKDTSVVMFNKGWCIDTLITKDGIHAYLCPPGDDGILMTESDLIVWKYSETVAFVQH